MKSAPNLPSKALSRKQRGFTLIEIAIVLVIIGLLLGGVLQGQQLIENSRVKSAVNSFNGIAAAMFSYQDRYGRLPGDDPEATEDRGESWPGATDGTESGDGNGVIDAAITDGFAGTDEVMYFFRDLRSAGFIGGDPTDGATDPVTALPANPFGGLMTVISATTHDSLNGTKVCMGNVGGSAAIALDTQLDDGNIESGRFRGTFDDGVPNADPGATADATAYSEDSSYTVCYRI